MSNTTLPRASCGYERSVGALSSGELLSASSVMTAALQERITADRWVVHYASMPIACVVVDSPHDKRVFDARHAGSRGVRKSPRR
jgi:hypothetical protein